MWKTCSQKIQNRKSQVASHKVDPLVSMGCRTGAYQLDRDSLFGWVREWISRSENFEYVDFHLFTGAV